MVLFHIFLMNINVEYIFKCLLTCHLHNIFGELSFKIFHLSFYQVVCFGLVLVVAFSFIEFREFFIYFGMSPLLDIWFEFTFSQSLFYLYILLTVVFEASKHFILVKSNLQLSILCFWCYT